MYSFSQKIHGFLCWGNFGFLKICKGVTTHPIILLKRSWQLFQKDNESIGGDIQHPLFLTETMMVGALFGIFATSRGLFQHGCCFTNKTAMKVMISSCFPVRSDKNDHK